jgi:hypothetical protein
MLCIFSSILNYGGIYVKKISLALLLLAFIAGFGISDSMAFSLGGKDLVKKGTGARTKTFVGTVYYASLYVPADLKGKDGRTILEADQPMSIVILVDTSLMSRKALIDALRDGFKNSAASGYSTDKMESFFSQFNSVELKKQAVISFNYVPNQGLSVTYQAPGGKAQALGTTGSVQFKKAFFAIFIGPRPAQESLKKGMLGN